MEQDNRRKLYVYERRPHLIRLNTHGSKYCRMANMILPFSSNRCSYCPLWNGECREVACAYYDLEGPTETSTAEEGKRTAAMIALGLAGEFPEFVDGKQWPVDAMVYENALKFAAEAHKGFFRKGTRIPYIVHPVEVSMIVLGIIEENTGKPRVQDFEVAAAAALHDVVEDTDRSLRDIGVAFGPRIESLVGFESEDKRKDITPEASWRIRKEEFLSHLENAPLDAQMIALGDKLSNIRAMAEDFKKLGDDMWSKFNQKDPAAHEWYYRSVGEILKELAASRFYEEYIRLCDEVFHRRA